MCQILLWILISLSSSFTGTKQEFWTKTKTLFYIRLVYKGRDILLILSWVNLVIMSQFLYFRACKSGTLLGDMLEIGKEQPIQHWHGAAGLWREQSGSWKLLYRLCCVLAVCAGRVISLALAWVFFCVKWAGCAGVLGVPLISGMVQSELLSESSLPCAWVLRTHPGSEHPPSAGIVLWTILATWLLVAFQ